jgi:quercetin dioxygenase-like cupin family protein
MFIYVLSGRLDAQSDGQSQPAHDGDIIHVPRGGAYRLQVKSPFARYVLVCATPYLEHRIDNMTPDEAAQARLEMKAN